MVSVTGEAYNFTKVKIPPWVFFTFFKLYKWYQIAFSHIHIFMMELLIIDVIIDKVIDYIAHI